MAAGIKTPAFDGVGYDVGNPAAPAPVGGFSGLLDFVGYPVGRPVPSGPPEGGFVGLLDFAGYPVGAPSVIPPAPPTAPPAPGGSVPISLDPITWAHEVGWSFRVDWRAESRLRRGRAAPATRKREPIVAPLPPAVVAPAAEPITWSAHGPTLEVRLELRGAVTFRSRLGAILEEDEELLELGLFDDEDDR